MRNVAIFFRRSEIQDLFGSGMIHQGLSYMKVIKVSVVCNLFFLYFYDHPTSCSSKGSRNGSVDINLDGGRMWGGN